MSRLLSNAVSIPELCMTIKLNFKLRPIAWVLISDAKGPYIRR